MGTNVRQERDHGWKYLNKTPEKNSTEDCIPEDDGHGPGWKGGLGVSSSGIGQGRKGRPVKSERTTLTTQ